MYGIPLTDDFREERGNGMINLIRRDMDDKTSIDHIRMTNRALYSGIDAPVNKPWFGSSNIHMPIVLEKVEGTVPKITNAFWGIEPVVHVRRVAEEFIEEETRTQELYFNWALECDIPNLYESTESWFRNTLIDGVSVMKSTWNRTWRNAVERHALKKMYDIGESDLAGNQMKAARDKSDKELLAEIFGIGSIHKGILEAELTAGTAEEAGTQTYFVSFMEDRRALEAHVVFQVSEFVDEIDLYVHRRVLEHDNPKAELVEFDDLLVPYRTKDLQTAARVTHQYWLTVDEVLRRAKRGEWDLSDDDIEIIKKRRVSRYEELVENQDLSRQRDDMTGERGNETLEEELGDPDDPYMPAYNQNKMLVFEVYLKDDVNADGDPVEVVYQIPYALRKIVRADYLDVVLPHARRPFADLHYRRVSGRWYSSSMADDLQAINIEVDVIVNAINNNQELINNPFFFYQPAAFTMDSAGPTGIQPGQGIPVMDPNGVSFPKFNQQPLSNFSAMDSLLMYADKLSVSPQNTGSSQARNAPRTARGTLALISEGNVKTDIIITRAQKGGWNELMHQLFGLYQAFMPEGKYYYVTGKKRPRHITAEEMRGRFEFSFSGNTVNTNREVLRTMSQVRYNTAMTHPDYSTDPRARRNLLQDFLRHHSEGVDVDTLMPAMPGEGGYAHPPMSQQDENRAMQLGMHVSVLPTDMHQEHLQVMDRFEDSKEFEQWEQWKVSMYAAHKNDHNNLLQQQILMQQEQANAGQGNNVPTGMTLDQGGTDLNALEGGVG